MKNLVVKAGEAGFPVVTVEADTMQMPEFTFAPYVGRRPLDELDTDMILVTKLYQRAIPTDLHAANPAIGELVRRAVKEGFVGKKGSSKLLEVQVSNLRGGKNGRYFFLAGLGDPTDFTASTACETIKAFVRTALELGVRKATIPFVTNRTTGKTLSLKSTAFRLKKLVAQVVASWDGPISLQEIQIYCHSAAVRHIKAGFAEQQCATVCKKLVCETTE